MKLSCGIFKQLGETCGTMDAVGRKLNNFALATCHLERGKLGRTVESVTIDGRLGVVS